MPRRTTDPAVKVIEYFETAAPEAAAVVLAVAEETLRRRLSRLGSKALGGPLQTAEAPTVRHRGPNKPKPLVITPAVVGE